MLAAVLAGLAASNSTGAPLEHPDLRFQPLLQQNIPVADARGIWKSRGYGWILKLDGSGMAVYQVSAAGCSADPRADDFRRQFAYRQVAGGETPNQLVIVQYPGENRYVFDRLPQLPIRCTWTQWDAPHLFEHFVASYREQYAFFKEHHFDWERRVRAERALITNRTSPRVLFAIFSDLLDSLGDAHVGLNTTFRGEPVAFRTGRGATLQRIYDNAAQSRKPATEAREYWLAAYNRGVRQVVLQGEWQESSQGKVVWGRIGDDLGYINIASVEGFTAGSLADNIRFINDLMDRILGEFAGVTAVILDITNNSGGYDRLSREIAGHFTERRTLAYTKRAYGAEGTAPDEFYTEPSSGRRFLGPAFLLTSDVTVSGGEILTLAMRALPTVAQVGTATRGALSDRLTKMLPDGSDFSISNEIYLDASGKLYEGIGIPPHRVLEFFPADDLERGHAKAVGELVKTIRSGTMGIPPAADSTGS